MRTHPTSVQWKNLEEYMRKEGVFSPRNLNAAALAERFRNNMAGVAFDMAWNPVAYAALWKTAYPKTYELGKLFVKRGLRGAVDWEARRIRMGRGVAPGAEWLSHAVLDHCHHILREKEASAHIFVSHLETARYMESELGWTNRGFGNHAQWKAVLRGEYAPESGTCDSRLHQPCHWLYYISVDFFDPPKEAIRLYA